MEKKAPGNPEEVIRRARNLFRHCQANPSFYKFTPGDLQSKWADCHTPPAVSRADQKQAAWDEEEQDHQRQMDIRRERENREAQALEAHG